MKSEKISICFVNGTNPKFLGGISIYQHNIIRYIKSNYKNIETTWIYKSDKDEKYAKEGAIYVGLKTKYPIFVDDIIFNIKVKKYLYKNKFDIVNSHAIWGHWMKNYKKRENQTIIHTYHGVTLPYYKVHLKRFGIIKNILLSPLLLYSYLIEKPPIKKANKIICVSDKVKKEIERTYKRKREVFVVRTGVDLEYFKKRNKDTVKKELGLRKDKIYGLHVAKGGYWIKGLDRAVRISEEIYKKNKDYKLIVIGSDYNKNKNLLDREFIIPLDKIPREKIPSYYSASDMFFCLSRYEGGAPTLVVSEAMASGCLLISSKDSEQEILEDEKNSIIIKNFDAGDADKILKIIENKKKKQQMIDNSIKKVKELSLNKWGKEYLSILK
jgi:glycosyltransferase involved in cell wall biosynthesis